MLQAVWLLKDTSSNGTFLNGRAIKKGEDAVQVHTGDTVSFPAAASGTIRHASQPANRSLKHLNSDGAACSYAFQALTAPSDRPELQEQAQAYLRTLQRSHKRKHASGEAGTAVGETVTKALQEQIQARAARPAPDCSRSALGRGCSSLLTGASLQERSTRLEEARQQLAAAQAELQQSRAEAAKLTEAHAEQLRDACAEVRCKTYVVPAT